MPYFSNGLERPSVIDFEKLDAVFLDLDDTIVDYSNSCIVGLARVRSLVPELARVDVGTMEQEFRDILRENLPALFDGKITVDEERILRMSEILKSHGAPLNDEFVSKCDQTFMEGFWNARSVMDGTDFILQLCDKLEIPVAIITNGNADMQRRTLEMLGLSDYIDHLLTPTTSRELKPNTGLFEKALSLTGADKRRTIMVGDTWQHDVLGALNTGIVPVWVNRRGIPRPDNLEVMEVKSLRDLVYSGNSR